MDHNHIYFFSKLLADFASNTIEVDSKRAINCKGAKREGHSDLIICKYKL
jgi:hypothetical protein